MKKSLFAAVAAIFVSTSSIAPVDAAPVRNKVMFMMDSSGGLYDPAFANWAAQIGWVENFINQTHRADGSNAYGIMTFGGLNPDVYSTELNINNGSVKVLHGLWPGVTNPHPLGLAVPSSEQAPADLSDYTSGITNDDFLARSPRPYAAGHTRTTEALKFLYDLFAQFSDSTTNKYIVMLTDGGFTTGFLPAVLDDTSASGVGFVSPVLQNLNAAGCNIAAVAVEGVSGVQQENLLVMISNHDLLFSVDGFDDFSDFLPAAQVASIHAPPAMALFIGGIAFLALRKRRAVA